ncbi:MAG: murein biosynthesis integral membrane protein MurJ [Desulfobacteraceae bacterium]|jgi:putative peptidoglycan lipid II flippase|nr:MAG: murein biosynthesis integral membrane protein MurJ [Desulfobacteraceae bacterium]
MGTDKGSREVNKAAGVVGFFTLMSRILGLVRDMVIARFFGSGTAADAFFVAFRIPNLLRRLFAEGSLTIAFIPVFTEYLALKGKRDAMEVASVVTTLLSLILAIVTVVGILVSPWLVRVQAFGFGGSGYKYELTVLLTRIMFPYIMLVSLVALFMGILNSLRHFAAPAAAPILLNAAIIAGAYLISPMLEEPIAGLAIAVLIGGILQVMLQIPWLIKGGFMFRPLWEPLHPAVMRIGSLMLPAIYGSAVYQVNQFVGTLLASLLEEGSVSWLYYADRLIQFPLGVFAIAISTAALPSLATHAAEKDLERFRSTFAHALRLVFFITLPSMAGLMVLGDPLIALFFQRGAFDSHSTIMTAKALFFYAVGLWAFSGIRVMVSAFYALQDTRTPVRVATLALVLNVAFSLLLMNPLKHGGLALSLSLASCVQFLLLGYYLKEKIGRGYMKIIAVSVGKAFFASAVMGAVLWMLLCFTWEGSSGPGGLKGIILLGGLVGTGAFIYLLIARLVRSPELSFVGEVSRFIIRKVAGGR